MKAKLLGMITVMLFSFSPLFGQNKQECERIAALTFEAFKQKTPEPAFKFLSDDFSIMGKNSVESKMILTQLINQLTINDYKKVSDSTGDNLILKYEVDYKGVGKRISTIVFNKENKISKLELLKMVVKKMNNDVATEKSTADSFTVPFREMGKIIVVQAKVDGIMRNFVLDSGSPKLVMNSANKNRAKIEHTMSISNIQGAGGNISNMNVEKINDFDFAGIKIKNQDVLTMDLEHLEKDLKADIYGLIGYEVIKDYDMLLDYNKKEVTFIKPSYTNQFITDHFKKNTISEVPIEMKGHIAQVKGVLGGKECMFGIDTGASNFYIDQDLYEGIKHQMTNIKKEKIVGADKNAIETKKGNLKELMVGTKSFKNIVYVFPRKVIIIFFPKLLFFKTSLIFVLRLKTLESAHYPSNFI